MEYFLALGIPFLILIIFGPVLIKFLKRINFGQRVRNDGPDSHFKKEGIPTMGGILIIIAILITALTILNFNSYIVWALIVTTGMGLIGFVDDIIKIKTANSLGLRAREKFLFQFIIALFLALIVYFFSDLGTCILTPFSSKVIELGIWSIPFIIITVVGTVNAVNLTDGLDGLAAGVTVIVSSGFALITSYLNFEQLTLFSLIISGACLGFIWFNSHPAQVFMGDVGSLTLGGALASIVVLSRTELFLLIIGGVYVLETLSVMTQVIYFKLTGGKRIFRMAPIHHHYELAGLAEVKVVARFWILSLVFALIGLAGFYLV
jgi:phospho-N-acetylmuramoyl-pentapeptide-transferase